MAVGESRNLGRETGGTLGTGSLRKALGVLRELGRADEAGLRLTELVGRTGLEPSTAHRMLACLVEEGFLQKSAAKRYTLGQSVFELGLVAAARMDAHDRADEPLRRLAARVGAVAALNLRTGDETVYLKRVQCPVPLPELRGTVGTRLPIGIGAGGVAMLATMREPEAEAMIRANEARYRSYDRHASALLRRRLGQARRDGFAVTESFVHPGISALGVVLPGQGTAPRLAIGIVGPGIDPRRLEAEVREMHRTAAEIAAACAV